MIRDEIRRSIRRAIGLKYGQIDLPDFSIEAPENPEHGDYATNAALVLAKVLKKPPMEIAAVIVNQLPVTSYQFKVAPPGFINFYVSGDALHRELAEILRKKNKYGAGAKKKEKIQVEFISANPTGPLTLANGRGGFYGDVLAKVLVHGGFKIEREYYINDAGNQVRTLGLSMLAAAGLIPEVEGYYRGQHITQWAKKNKNLLKKKQNDPEAIGRSAANSFLSKLIRPAVEKKMKIHFDRWTSEYKDIRGKKFVEKATAVFKEKGLAYSKEGAMWLKTTEFGDDKDRVLVTSDGFPTYFLVDAGHYLATKERGFSKINIVGADHHGYVSRIQAAARILGLKKSEVIVMQLVRLLREGEEVRMSKRKGTFVTIDELIGEVGLDAARYFFLEKSPDTHIDFDLDLAKERSAKNPVYYIQYAHARMASIFRKAKNYKLRAKNYKVLKEKEELDLIKKLIQFPEVVEDIARDYQVHRLTRYALELARTFHNFYEKQRVITKDKELTGARLSLVKATRIVLQCVLNLLGIRAPDKM